MKTKIHPALFLCGALAVSAVWLWLQPAPAAPRAAAIGAPRAPAAPQPSVRVDPATLQRYAGRYELEGIAIEIRVENGRLIAKRLRE